MRIMCVWLAQVMRDMTVKSYEQVHYFPTLQKMGHDVFLFPLQPVEAQDAALIDSVEYLQPDIMIVKLYRTEIRKETIDYITRNTNTTTIAIHGDDEKYFTNFDGYKGKDETMYADEYALMYDYVITTYKPAVGWYKKMGIDAIHSCYGANHWEYKKLNLKKIFDCSFCGAINPERVRVCDNIMLNDIKMKVYGNGWDGDKSILVQSDYAALFNRTKVNLNISLDIIGERRVPQIKGRDFEVPMSGGFILNRDNDLLREYFEFGKEIETYKSDKEMIDKIKYYTTHDTQREKIAQAGYERSRKCHTYKHRFKNIFSQIELKNGGRVC